MITICIRDRDLVRAVSAAVGDGAATCTAAGLFNAVRREMPLAVVMEAEVGGGRTGHAAEWAPLLRKMSPDTEIVLLIRSPSVADVLELNRLGVYTYADLDLDGWRVRISEVISFLRHRRVVAQKQGDQSQ